MKMISNTTDPAIEYNMLFADPEIPIYIKAKKFKAIISQLIVE